MVHPIAAGHDTDLGCNGHPVMQAPMLPVLATWTCLDGRRPPIPPHPPKSVLNGRFDPTVNGKYWCMLCGYLQPAHPTLIHGGCGGKGSARLYRTYLRREARSLWHVGGNLAQPNCCPLGCTNNFFPSTVARPVFYLHGPRGLPENALAWPTQELKSYDSTMVRKIHQRSSNRLEAARDCSTHRCTAKLK